jgi:hypothetical protein
VPICADVSTSIHGHATKDRQTRWLNSQMPNLLEAPFLGSARKASAARFRHRSADSRSEYRI